MITNEELLRVLNNIGARVVEARQSLPDDPNVRRKHLLRALAGIEFKVYTARHGLTTASEQQIEETR